MCVSGQPVWQKSDTRIGLIDGSVSDGRFPLLDAILFLSLAAENFFDLVEDTTPTEDATAGLERWKCGSYFDGCGFLATDCVTLTANVRNGTGDVEFDGFAERTRFRIQGIERRWDWCLADDFNYHCAFVISVNGTGRYYNFRGSRVKASDLFKCTKR